MPRLLSVLRRRHLPRNAEYDAHLRQLAQQGRAAVAEEGEGNTGGGHQARDHRNVQKGLQTGEGHEAYHQQSAEPVPGVEGDPEAPEDQQGEYQHDDAGTHQAQLLADHGEDAVVVLLGQVEKFLPSLAQAHAQQAAGADGDETLGDLPAVAPVPIGVEGVPPGVDAVLAIVEDALFHQGDVQGAHQAHAGNAGGDQPALNAAHDHQNDAGADNEDGAGQMRLQHHKPCDNAQDQQIRPDALTPGLHFLALFGDGGGKVDDHGDLGDLGGLEPQNGALDAQPAGGAVFRDDNGGFVE